LLHHDCALGLSLSFVLTEVNDPLAIVVFQGWQDDTTVITDNPTEYHYRGRQ